jgi:hypothetical protein
MQLHFLQYGAVALSHRNRARIAAVLRIPGSYAQATST